MLSRILLCLAALASSTSALADTVWMKNGDRLTGKITLFDGGKLLLKTDYGGDITLKWDKISTFESEQNLLVKQDAETGEHSKGIRAAGPGQVTLVNGEPKTVELASIQQMMPPKPILQDWVWNGNVDFSLDRKQAENDVSDYDIDFKTNARHGLWRHNVQGEYNREKKNGLVSTDNYSGQYALDRFIDDHWFWQGQVAYKRDMIEDLAKKRTVGTGPGYQFWDNELGAFSIATLVNRNDYEFADGEKEHFYSSSFQVGLQPLPAGQAVRAVHQRRGQQAAAIRPGLRAADRGGDPLQADQLGFAEHEGGMGQVQRQRRQRQPAPLYLRPRGRLVSRPARKSPAIAGLFPCRAGAYRRRPPSSSRTRPV